MSGQFGYFIKTRIKTQKGFFCALAVAAIAALLFLFLGLAEFCDRIFFDALMNQRIKNGSAWQNPLITSIDLNDRAEEILKSRLDTREAFADALEVLAGSDTAVALDFQFRISKDNDAPFVNAVAGSKNPVLGVLGVEKHLMNSAYKPLSEAEEAVLNAHLWHIKERKKGAIPEAGTFLMPFPELGKAAAQLAHINMEPDPDGIYRRVPLLYKWRDGYIPSLPLATAVLREGIDPSTIELYAGSYLMLPLSEDESIRIPVDNRGCAIIPYTGTWAGSVDRIPLHTIVEAKYDEAAFDTLFSDLSGHVAIIAETSTGQKDYGPTAFERLFPLSGVHAAILNGILNNTVERSFIESSGRVFKILAIFFLVSGVFFMVNIKKDPLFHITAVLLFLLYTVLVLFRWYVFKITPWYAIPVLFLFVVWIAAFIFRLLARYREQLLLQNALSRYFPRSLAVRIMREGKTELVPAYKELTILFSDISGFTKWSSDKSPEDVHTFLSDYLESMAAILFAHGGTVDKFMGDGILAFFGDPFEYPDHLERCLNAACAMQKKIRELAVKWKPLVDIDLKVRVGINTGKVIVGNLGTKTRIEYTVIGSAVNLAQRMESNAIVGGILVTNDVRQKAPPSFIFAEKRQITVKGYEEKIEGYDLDWEQS